MIFFPLLNTVHMPGEGNFFKLRRELQQLCHGGRLRRPRALRIDNHLVNLFLSPPARSGSRPAAVEHFIQSAAPIE